jgi:anti-sigma B factor antagonist
MDRPEQVLFAARAVRLDGYAVCLEVEGELDLATAPQLEEMLCRELDADHEVILDLSGVTFMDSSGLRAIVTSTRAANSNGARLRISGSLLPQIRRLIEITGLQGVLPMERDLLP